jgi:metal-responsive CopG/Arc/MetJ family transcriptional regulator
MRKHQPRTAVVANAKPRVSVTFPAEHYAALERIAKEKRVSTAWVVREAVQKYLEPEATLFTASS